MMHGNKEIASAVAISKAVRKPRDVKVGGEKLGPVKRQPGKTLVYKINKISTHSKSYLGDL